MLEQPWLHVTDNVVMNSWIFREAMLAGVKHVIFPSCTVMYESSPVARTEDSWSRDEISDTYFGVGTTKVYLEDMCKFYANAPGSKTKFTAIRHSNVYGPHDKFDLDRCHMVPAMIRKVIESDGEVEVWGKGKAIRDILYIDDLMYGFKAVLDRQTSPYELVNMGYSYGYSISDIINALAIILSKDIEINYNTSIKDIPTTLVLDCNKAYRLFGWNASTSLGQGLEKTVEWYKETYDNKLN